MGEILNTDNNTLPLICINYLNVYKFQRMVVLKEFFPILLKLGFKFLHKKLIKIR